MTDGVAKDINNIKLNDMNDESDCYVVTECKINSCLLIYYIQLSGINLYHLILGPNVKYAGQFWQCYMNHGSSVLVLLADDNNYITVNILNFVDNFVIRSV